jgi:hypothetical protein
LKILALPEEAIEPGHFNTHSFGTYVPVEEPSTASKAEVTYVCIRPTAASVGGCRELVLKNGAVMAASHIGFI